MTLIVIPSRLASTRLPNKPLALIQGKPMIQRVFEQAKKAKIGEVVVATCCEEIASVIRNLGGNAIITDPSLSSGTDRVYAAVKQMNKRFDRIINVQGDMPFISPETIEKAASIFQSDTDISTLCTPITDESELSKLSVVKPVLSFVTKDLAKALYFSRLPVPYGAKTHYHHLGIYGYTFEALERYVSLSPSPLELSESLEQLRALEAGMTIHVGFVDKAPLAIDTPEDLERAQSYHAI